jgi:hypothetical protein
MEALSSVMSLIDQNSESIPEGDYLKLCNLMKVLHTAIPKPQPSVPFSARPRLPQSLREDSVRHQRAYSFAEERVLRINQQLKRIKIRKRITVGVKADAVHDCCERLGFPMVFCVEDLREKGVLIEDERAFYKDFLDRETLILSQKRYELLGDRRGLERERDEARATMVETFRAIDAYRALRV